MSGRLGAWMAAVLLLSACAGAGRDTPLTAAAARGDVRDIRALLAAGDAPDGRDGSGRTALGWAARGGHVAAMRLLLGAGAGPDLRDARGNGWTPLLHAVHTRRAGALETLLRAGADPSAPSRRGDTPLRMAAGYGEAAAVRALLAAGANPATDPARAAILTDAVGGAWDLDYRWSGCEPHTRVVRALLARAPDLEMGTGLRARLARRHARARGCTELLALLDRPAARSPVSSLAPRRRIRP